MSHWQYQVKAEPLVTTEAPTVPDFSWQPDHPDLLRRSSPHADLAPIAAAPAVSSTLLDLAWRAVYPDRLVRRATIPAIDAVGSPVETLPAPDRSWAPAYPDWLARFRPLYFGPETIEAPFQPPTVALLSAWGIYPDRPTRRTLSPAHLPFFVPGPLVPIPDERVASGKDRVVIGSKESFNITQDPNLGGWSW